MPIQMLQPVRNCVHISRFHDDSLNSVADHITRFTRGDLRQSARRRFIRDFLTDFPLRRVNVKRSLVEIILGVAHKADDANVITPELA